MECIGDCFDGMWKLVDWTLFFKGFVMFVILVFMYPSQKWSIFNYNRF
jgi:hypothetical protein